MNHVHPSAIIEGNVNLGESVTICAGAIIQGPVNIGDHVYIGAGVSIGSISRERIDPANRLADPISLADAWVHIGAATMVFDQAVIHKPILSATRIGEHVEIGALAMVAHDCLVRDNAVIAPRASLGAYVRLGTGANIGLGTSVHHRLAVGALAMCGLGAAVVGHVPPGAMVFGNPARIRGVNHVGLQRANIPPSQIQAIEIELKEDPTPSLHHSGFYEEYRRDIEELPSTKGQVKWQVLA